MTDEIIPRSEWDKLREGQVEAVRASLALSQVDLENGHIVRAHARLVDLRNFLEQERCAHCASRPNTSDPMCDQCIPF